MSKAYVFPGQGAQFVGMGAELYQSNNEARAIFESANEVLGFSLTDIIFNGTDEDLKQTKVTQPAVFTFSYIDAKINGGEMPEMVAGHSLGEFTALAYSEALSFENALALVYKRALAMQRACELQPSTMAAILGLPDDKVVELCATIQNNDVIAANFNCPGQVVVSGSVEAVNLLCEKAKEAGAKRALPLKVGGAFHSKYMEAAREELSIAIEQTPFSTPRASVYQNVDAKSYTDSSEIKANLIKQLTAPVLWTQIVQNMVADGCTKIFEYGPGTVLRGLVKKIDSSVELN